MVCLVRLIRKYAFTYMYTTESDEVETDTPGVITIDDEEEEEDLSVSDSDPLPETVELPSIELHCGIIKPGDTIELKDHSGRSSDRLISGDFLRVKAIIEDLETKEITIRGERFRRIAYQRPLFDFKSPSKPTVSTSHISLTNPSMYRLE